MDNWEKMWDSLGDLGTAVATAYGTSAADRLIDKIQGGEQLAQPGVESVYQTPKQAVNPVVAPIQTTAGDKVKQMTGISLPGLLIIGAIIYVIMQVAD